MESSTKRGGKTHFDRISSLPDELVGHILSYLPTRFAVSTSILSTRWRYLFTLTDCLSFDDVPCFSFRGIDTDKKQRFQEFVYKVLQLHQISPIKKFSLVCQAAYKNSDLNEWVSNAVQKEVQELHYQVLSDVPGNLPDALVACETLVRLELRSCTAHRTKIPVSASLPSLKVLHLHQVMFFGMFSIQRLFSSSKMLEELTLCHCGLYTSGHGIISARRLKVLRIENCRFKNYLKDGFLEIDAPNLTYLIYKCNVGVKIVPSWKYSCSLVKAELNFSGNPYASDSDSVEYDSEIFKTAAYKTTELSLFSNPVEFLLKIADQEQMPMFHSLSKLHLGHICTYSWKYVTSLLDKSPQLETVVFEKGLLHCRHDLVTPPSEPFSCHAQVIEVRKCCTHNGSLLHLGHLLRNARFLKKLIVESLPCFTVTKKEMPIRKDLIMNLPRASSDCCIELK